MDGFLDPVEQARLDAAQYRHPQATVFHMLFRTLALVTYILSPFSFLLTFIAVILLLSFDFWTVKNISGRLLVGLRWWNRVRRRCCSRPRCGRRPNFLHHQITDDGESSWLFESKPRFVPHPGEARIFWWSLYLFTAAWVLLAFVAVLKLNFAHLVCQFLSI